MRRLVSLLAIGLVLALGAGCKSPEGNTREQKRAAVRQMRTEALNKLYADVPAARSEVANGVGYAVFDLLGTNLGLLATGKGFGIATDNRSGKETYMRMIEIGGGPGLGIKDFWTIMIFKTPGSFERFTTYGLEIGGEADAGLVSDDTGDAVSTSESAESLAGEVEIYIVNESGAALQAVASGTKYYVDDELN